jgi:hypothetical protein
MEIVDINKHYGKLKMKCFEMPNASYTNRCSAFKKTDEKNIINNNISSDFEL